jgi:pimeloyl-ACP methyl ester carboxylesterase
MTAEVRRIDVDGARLHVRIDGAGPALVFLHGWTLDGRMWDAQRRSLAANYRVVVPDRRGWGRSTGTPDLAREPGDVVALLDRFGIERAALCAASQAGRAALRFALSHPRRLRALILQGAALDGMPEPPDDPGFVPVAEYAQLVRAGREDEFRRRWLAHPPGATTCALRWRGWWRRVRSRTCARTPLPRRRTSPAGSARSRRPR